MFKKENTQFQCCECHTFLIMSELPYGLQGKILVYTLLLTFMFLIDKILCARHCGNNDKIPVCRLIYFLQDAYVRNLLSPWL